MRQGWQPSDVLTRPLSPRETGLGHGAALALLLLCAPLHAAPSLDIPAQIGELRQRVQAVHDSQPNALYVRAKTQAWLDYAFDEYIDQDNTGVVQHAMQQAQQLVSDAEAGRFTSFTAASEAKNAQPTSAWTQRLAALRANQDAACAAPYIGRIEVQMEWSQHELDELGARHARPYQRQVERLLQQAEQAAAQCKSSVPQATASAQQAASAPAPAQTQTERITTTLEATVLARELAKLPTAVHFAYKHSDLSPASERVLRQLAATLRAYPSLRLQLVGHTDQIANQAYNLALSQRRVDAVQAYLVQMGVSSSRFLSLALGKQKLLLEADTPDARARNRRVEFNLINAAEAGAAAVQREAQEQDLQP